MKIFTLANMSLHTSYTGSCGVGPLYWANKIFTGVHLPCVVKKFVVSTEGLRIEVQYCTYSRLAGCTGDSTGKVCKLILKTSPIFVTY